MNKAISLWNRRFPDREAFFDWDRFFDDFTMTRSPLMRQAERVKETESAFLLSVDMPGVKAADLNLEIKDGQLRVEAHRSDMKESENESAQVEAHYLRVWSLPEIINQEGLEAHLEDGVLHIVLPKTEPAKAKKIEVKSGESPFLKKLLGGQKKNVNQ